MGDHTAATDMQDEVYRQDLEPYLPRVAEAARPAGPRALLLAALRGSAFYWFALCLAVISDAWVQLPLSGTIDAQQLGWTALASLSGLLVLYGIAAGELWAVGSLLTAALAVIGRLTGAFHAGILLGLLILTVAALRLRNTSDRRGRNALIGVGVSTSALLALFVFLDWLSSIG